MSKQRLDQVLVARGLVPTRSQAESWVRMGKVFVRGQAATKPGMFVAEDAEIELKADGQYVSRAGHKLASVAQVLHLNFSGKVVLDVGSSTGGFTDYALQHDARKVIAVDVGTDQLHPSLRGDPKIELHEQTDIRNVFTDVGGPVASSAPKNESAGAAPPSFLGAAPRGTTPQSEVSTEARNRATSGEELRRSAAGGWSGETLGSPASPPRGNGSENEVARLRERQVVISEVPDIVVIDVSFISLREILPHVARLSGKNTKIAAMLKPQFEAGHNAKHKGVIKNDAMRRTILKDFEAWSRTLFIILDKADSEVAGTKGNRERFYLLQKLPKG